MFCFYCNDHIILGECCWAFGWKDHDWNCYAHYRLHHYQWYGRTIYLDRKKLEKTSWNLQTIFKIIFGKSPLYWYLNKNISIDKCHKKIVQNNIINACIWHFYNAFAGYALITQLLSCFEIHAGLRLMVVKCH